MVLIPADEARNVTGLTDEQTLSIKNFLQGAVYAWIKDHPNDQFAARDMVGGINTDWTRTPLFALYDKHIKLGKTEKDASDEAAKDLGHLLKAMLHADKRYFLKGDAGMAAGYTWIGTESHE